VNKEKRPQNGGRGGSKEGGRGEGREGGREGERASRTCARSAVEGSAALSDVARIGSIANQG